MTGPIFDPARLGPPPGARVAVVGGCGGMGRQLVRALLQTGVSVAVLDLSSSMVQNPPPSQVLAIDMDGSDEASVATAFDILGQHWPALDGFVNLAGFFKGWQPIAELSVAIFDEIIAGNLRCHFLCARAALPMLHRSDNGAMVSVASTMAVDVVKGYTHYGAAKAGLHALTLAMAREYAPKVRVNCIMPGAVPTEIMMTAMKLEDNDLPALEKRLRLPMRRLGTPDDLGQAVLYFVSPASSWVTAQILSVDGGM